MGENNGWEVDGDYGWSMDEEQMTMDEYGWKLVQNGWRMDEKRLEKCVEMNNKWKNKKNMFKKIIFEGFWTTFHKKQHLLWISWQLMDL